MIEAMSADLDAIEGRLQEYRAGKDDFVGLFRIVEEGADTFKTLQAMGKDAQKVVEAWLSKFTTVTRKIKARMCIVSVKLSGADFGTGAESRNDATIVFPGAKGIAKTMSDDRIFKLENRIKRFENGYTLFSRALLNVLLFIKVDGFRLLCLTSMPMETRSEALLEFPHTLNR